MNSMQIIILLKLLQKQKSLTFYVDTNLMNNCFEYLTHLTIEQEIKKKEAIMMA